MWARALIRSVGQRAPQHLWLLEPNVRESLRALTEFAPRPMLIHTSRLTVSGFRSGELRVVTLPVIQVTIELYSQLSGETKEEACRNKPPHHRAAQASNADRAFTISRKRDSPFSPPFTETRMPRHSPARARSAQFISGAGAGSQRMRCSVK